jgi:hypothetical protein
VALGVGPEFKPQYGKKKKQKQNPKTKKQTKTKQDLYLVTKMNSL